MNNRLKWIDASKGIGTILVVYGHVMRGLNSSSIDMDRNLFQLADRAVYSFHMPLFFFLSGLFFSSSLSKRGLNSFIKEKISTLAYPYLIWSLIQVSVEVILSKYTNGHANPSDLLWCLVLPKAQFWFLYALLFICILNAFIFHLCKKIAIHISFCLSLILFTLKITETPYVYIADFWIYFNIGIIVANVTAGDIDKLHVLARTRYIIPIGVAFLVTEILYLFYLQDIMLKTLLPQILGSVLTIQLSMLVSDRKFIFGRMLEKIGTFSFEIYLVHILVASGIRIILLQGAHMSNFMVHLVLGIVFGICLPIWFARLANKNPYTSWLFHLPK